jgi:hypothetical protein
MCVSVMCVMCPCLGEATLRKAICADLQRRKGVTYAPEEIIVGNGAKQGVYQAILALCRYTEAHIIMLQQSKPPLPPLAPRLPASCCIVLCQAWR